MSWITNYKYRWYETLYMNILKVGPIPNHVAFIMDGNRRFAKTNNINKIDGHSKGFEKLTECLQWCLDMEIKEVTVFAFSIENFKRSKDEVKDLLHLAKQKFDKLLEEEDKLRENGIRIRILGDIVLLPKDLQSVIAKAMLVTEKNNKLFLNIAFAYTSQNEITSSIHEVLLDNNELESEDIDERLISNCLYTSTSPEPDLLFRTSGESRISDFLMWQLSSTVLYFTNCLWPQLTILDFLCALFVYQLKRLNMKTFKSDMHQTLKNKNYLTSKENLDSSQKQFVKGVEKRRKEFLVNIAN